MHGTPTTLLLTALLLLAAAPPAAQGSAISLGMDAEGASQQVDLSLTRNPVQGPCMPKKIVSAGGGGGGGSLGLSGLDGGSGGIEICRKMEWNTTYNKNLLSYDTKSFESFHYIGTWQPLIEMGCSPSIERLLCSLVVPICNQRKGDVSGNVYILQPCKELCEHARAGCASIMKEYGFPWPFHCDDFNSGIKEGETEYTGMCVPPELGVAGSPVQPAQSPGNSGVYPKQQPANTTASRTSLAPSFVCPSKLAMKRDIGYSFLGQPDCSAPCRQVLFTQPNYRLARYWIGAWSAVCFLSSLFTFFTYLVDSSRFKYPERPIIILSTCYVFISGTFLVGFFAQGRVSCNSHDTRSADSAFAVVTQSISNGKCTLSFIVLYYFLMASSLWWVVLSFTWFLAAGLKWSQEAIERKAVLFHLLAWVTPLVQTILVLFFQGIEGDDVSGTCFTGILNVQYTLYFLLLPLSAFLLIGFVFLMCGFVSMCRVRHFIKKSGDRTDKLEKLMMRIGIFSLFYMVPAVVLIACFAYEHTYRATWHRNWWRDHCHNYHTSSGANSCIQLRRDAAAYREVDSPEGSAAAAHPSANFYVFLLRYFVTLAVGVTSSFWLWSRKTLASWRHVICHVTSSAAQPKHNPPPPPASSVPSSRGKAVPVHGTARTPAYV